MIAFSRARAASSWKMMVAELLPVEACHRRAARRRRTPRRSRASAGVPGSTTSRASSSASMCTAPCSTSRRATVDFPEAIPPVRPIRYTLTTLSVRHSTRRRGRAHARVPDRNRPRARCRSERVDPAASCSARSTGSPASSSCRRPGPGSRTSGCSLILVVLLVLEFVADKIPGFDSVNDLVQTVVRPTSGGLAFSSGVDATDRGGHRPRGVLHVAAVGARSRSASCSPSPCTSRR